MTDSLPAQELTAEIERLQQELRELAREAGQDGDSVWLFRLFQGVEPDRLEELISKPDFSQWMALPLDGDHYPVLKKLQATLECLAYQSEHDPLTGLANRRAFERFLDMEIERTKRAKTPLSLAMFDLDDFKKVNDTYGHPTGDEVLKGFADLLSKHTRRYDMAARLGGEEFALILAGSGKVKAHAVLSRLLAELPEIPFAAPDGAEFRVTCSIGLTCYKGGGSPTVDDLVSLADEALYQAKGDGKNRIVVGKMPFKEPPTVRTIVHSNEKQFLFGTK